MAEDAANIGYQKDIYGQKTDVVAEGEENKAAFIQGLNPAAVAMESAKAGEYGKAAGALFIPGVTQAVAKGQIKEEQERFAKEQALAGEREEQFQKSQTAFFGEQERQQRLAQQQLAESPYTTSFAQYGGYVNPVAKVESPEYVGNRKVYGQTHEGPNQGVDVGYASNGLPMAGHGGTLGTPIGNNEGIDNNFVWSDSVFLNEDEYKEFLT